MKYQVPQFIEVEDKIFGPLTLKQFLYVAGGAAIVFILWRMLPQFIAILVCVPGGGFFLSLAFLKINQRPFINTIEYAFKYYIGEKLYIWKKNEKKPTQKIEESQGQAQKGYEVPKLSQSRLKELSWSLDINEKIGEDSNN